MFFPAWHPCLLLASHKSQTKDGCGNLWPPELVTGEISGKGHHGKGVGPWIDLLELC